MKKTLFALVASAAVFAAGCEIHTNVTPASGISRDSVVRHVIEDATVIDDFGHSQPATCEGDVRFWGQVDHYCGAMLDSDFVTVDLLCGYYDWFDEYQEQYETFDLDTGYVQEECDSDGFIHTLAATKGAITASTDLSTLKQIKAKSGVQIKPMTVAQYLERVATKKAQTK